MHDQQTRHAVLADPNHDELARQGFVSNLRIHVMTAVSDGTRQVYERKVRPAFEKVHARAPKDRHEVRKAMEPEAQYQNWSALLRTTQELMWDAVGASVERQLPDLMRRARTGGRTRGSLRLDPGLRVPGYQAAVDTHVMPGSYHTDLAEGDVFAGAIYDRGLYIYAMGGLGPLNADIGGSGAAYLRENFPDLKPKRILDMGCTIGNSTLAWAEAFPDAEVHGIDVGAASLRYAHARAESLGARVHFSQQNAEATDFPDGHFDVVASAVLLHETSGRAIANILRESRRLLRPGGVMCHVDVPQVEGDAFDLFIPDWDTYNNNEPFMGRMRDTDIAKLAKSAGFSRYFHGDAPAVRGATKTGVSFRGGEGKKGKPWHIYGGVA